VFHLRAGDIARHFKTEQLAIIGVEESCILTFLLLLLRWLKQPDLRVHVDYRTCACLITCPNSYNRPQWISITSNRNPLLRVQLLIFVAIY
jgi:hypothetical protein